MGGGPGGALYGELSKIPGPPPPPPRALVPRKGKYGHWSMSPTYLRLTSAFAKSGWTSSLGALADGLF